MCVLLYVCECICVYVCYVYVHACMNMWVYMCECVCVCLSVYACIAYVHTYMCACVTVWMYVVDACVCVSECMCCVHVCTACVDVCELIDTVRGYDLFMGVEIHIFYFVRTVCFRSHLVIGLEWHGYNVNRLFPFSESCTSCLWLQSFGPVFILWSYVRVFHSVPVCVSMVTVTVPSVSEGFHGLGMGTQFQWLPKPCMAVAWLSLCSVSHGWNRLQWHLLGLSLAVKLLPWRALQPLTGPSCHVGFLIS